MKTIKVSEATPSQLAWLVAKCEGEGNWPIWKTDGYYCQLTKSWDQGDPIIERERISIKAQQPDWTAYIAICDGMTDRVLRGPTPLIAVMRCFVCSRLGETVEIPEELE